MLAAGAGGGADGWVMGAGAGAEVEGCAELDAAAGAGCAELDAVGEAVAGCGGAGAGTVKLTVALVEGRTSSATRRWCCPGARP
jgi:hypothetical protein